MKSMIAGFLTTALLLALHVAPPPEALQGLSQRSNPIQIHVEQRASAHDARPHHVSEASTFFLPR